MTRKDRLMRGIDPAGARGAEIGALAAPIVARSDGPITYIDHATTAELKAKYGHHDGLDMAAMVEVDAVWGDNTIEAALGSAAPVDYIVASHVIEHAPDLIGWLKELASVLAPGGKVRLAIPDKRYCFDYLRDETRLSDVLAAHFARARRPQPREVIDSELHHRPMDARAAWAGAPVDPDILTRHDLDRAFAFAGQARETYVDVHCWAFTPAGFARLMGRMARLGLTPFACDFLDPTEVNSLEFFAGLRLEADPEAAAQSWRSVEGAAQDHGARESEAQLLKALAAVRAEVDQLRASTSWRITAPLRAVAERLRPR